MMWSPRTPALFLFHSLKEAHRNAGDQDDIFNYTPIKNKKKKRRNSQRIVNSC